MEDYKEIPIDEWSEVHVAAWLKEIGVKQQYITKFQEKEVTGPVLKRLQEAFLKDKIGMQDGQIDLVLSERKELLDSSKKQKSTKQTAVKKVGKNSTPTQESEQVCRSLEQNTVEVNARRDQEPHKVQNENLSEGSSLPQSEMRPFDTEDINFKYVKHTVLLPESGSKNLIIPCHEYKAFTTAAVLDRMRLQSKFAFEVIRFGSGCMNVRTNGTIHFGVVDSVENSENCHGEIVGIPVESKDIYVDALDYIERCFKNDAQREEARHCIRPPKFIEVIGKGCQETRWIVEVDIVSSISIVKGKRYTVSLPKYNEKNNKIEFGKKTVFRRVGAKTEPITSEEELDDFIISMADRDRRREEAEALDACYPAEETEDLGRKLHILLTCGRKLLDDSLWYILVTNKWDSESLEYMNFLLHMKIFCVFDFDPDSKTSGFCNQYQEHHAVNAHFLQNYMNESGLSTSEFIKHLQLVDKTSWIFCNGRNDYHGDEKSCDEKLWMRTKKKYLKKAISIICNEILPKSSFVVIFLLMSQIEQPIVEAFHEFHSELTGSEYLVCVSESKKIFTKWANLAQTSCSIDALNQMSIVGMKMSHVDETVQSIQPITVRVTKHLAVHTGGLCLLRAVDEEKMVSLEVLSVDECENINPEYLDKEEIKNTERYFYHGGKVNWKLLWLADNKYCGDIIQREAYGETAQLLDDTLKSHGQRRAVARINMYHHPGSGGSTTARQILWNYRKKLRCAVVKQSHSVTSVCENAIFLREYEEKDINNCVPVLLLVEDCDEEYLDDLKHELGEAMSCKKTNPSVASFILLSCKRSHDPEKMCKISPSQTVAVTHKLTDKEKVLFRRKCEELEQEYEPYFVLTFVLMSKEFEEKYIKDFVQHLLQGIDHSSLVTYLIRYVALLNCYLENSYISVSHCIAFLGIGVEQQQFYLHAFENSLGEQGRLVFIHLRESTTHISSIRIIHPLVAKEILRQLSDNQPQSTIAVSLLQEKVLFEHRFGRDDYVKFLRNLFIRRHRKSRGDDTDTFFAPLIMHILDEEKNPQKAIELLIMAYLLFGEDPFFAQQLARLHYTHNQFEDAKKWAEKAKSKLPNDSIILHTEGQVYRKWFNFLYPSPKGDITAENTSEIIQIALKAMECFRASEKADKAEMDHMNNTAYFGEVDVGCRLLQLIENVDIFTEKNGHCELQRYLLTDYIPVRIEKYWQTLHGHIKGLQRCIYEALEWISEDLSYFQTDKTVEEEEQQSKELEHVYNPRNWLLRKAQIYARFFSFSSNIKIETEPKNKLTPLMKRMLIYRNGGGNITTILSMLTDNENDKSGQNLEKIISMYPKDLQKERLDPLDLVNYITSQIALGCALPRSVKRVTLEKLQQICMQLRKLKNYAYPPTAAFLLSILFWPDGFESNENNRRNNEILLSAIDTLKRLYGIKIKNIPPRKKRIYTHFFLGNGKGLDRIIHRSKVEKILKCTFNERRLKWLSGEVWEMKEFRQLLKQCKGWTEDGGVFVRGAHKDSKIHILPMNSASMPNANENVIFYLGFSFYGPVAFNVQIDK
uniref:Sterile alpha motif domain-containing protein 9-like n=1 Tax=Erpetoichthys calabaricus TaxID=27687 RepID=A0A8C4T5K0_ERPCA